MVESIRAVLDSADVIREDPPDAIVARLTRAEAEVLAQHEFVFGIYPNLEARPVLNDAVAGMYD